MVVEINTGFLELLEIFTLICSDVFGEKIQEFLSNFTVKVVFALLKSNYFDYGDDYSVIIHKQDFQPSLK